jgi:hypothetical protein
MNRTDEVLDSEKRNLIKNNIFEIFLSRLFMIINFFFFLQQKNLDLTFHQSGRTIAARQKTVQWASHGLLMVINKN